MSKLKQLYQQLIIDHSQKPRNFGRLETFSHHCEGHNPLCGDDINLFLLVDEENLIRDIKFEGQGCSISQASASMLSERVKGCSIDQALKLFRQFQGMILGELDPDKDTHDLGKTAVFGGVKEYPSRIKCAILAWHALKGALEKEVEEISTE
ncbi:MAG: SUF system NifU family Fe-S cluster assembly protein [Candidatus Caenarcaniphilales bacterium]|nr:SUF system NifU family Fe-S cluster assembly protein [Candidatus Caenarcaniphilales bacterium]